MDDLSFDPVKVDTSLAKEYIEKIDVVAEPKPGTAWDYKSKTYFKLYKDPFYGIKKILVTGLNQKLRNLSKKLKENTELFCQLEYLMRKVDVDETRNCHLKLISQYLRLEDGERRLYSPTFEVIMEENTPLYYLGHVATTLRDGGNPILVCKKTTAPICKLFYELCLDVGLEISFNYINNSDEFRFAYPPLSMGCTLAITEEADMDSAVDVFLNSSAEAAWRIERIYVQESVYEQLMETLETRCTREASDRCEDVFHTARGRRVECGAGAGAGGGVPVRAYRGARDLLALLPPGGSLSLWCGAAAAAHELALAASADLVWIDHYAVFEGPPSASIPLYNFNIDSRYIPEYVHTRLLELQRKWIALPLDERKNVVLGVLREMRSHKEDVLRIEKLVEGIAAWTPVADLIDITSDRITMVIDRPHTEIHLIDDVFYVEIKMLKLLKSIIRGCRGIQDQVCNTPDKIISELCNAGVPVIKSEVRSDKTSECTREIKLKSPHSNKKVIHSRFGTIYSN